MIGIAARTSTLESVRKAAAIADDVPDLLASTAAAVRRAVPHGASAWMATDPSTRLFSHGHVEAFDAETCAPWFHNEFAVADVHKFHVLPAGRAAIGSQIDDRALSSPRWSELMRPAGFDDELRVRCDDANGSWAAIELHREVGQSDFDRDEVALLEEVAPMLAAGIRRIVTAEAARRPAPDGPGIVEVHPDGSVTPLTPSGAAWLELMGTGNDRYEHSALLGIATLGAALADGLVDPSQARLRTRTADGRWLTLHAQPRLADTGTLVVLEPSAPAEVATVLSRGYGLTDREVQIVMSVARGESTRAMAEGLFLSPHTVRDHVKSAMAKVGVGTRGELVATLFERHYAADFFGSMAHPD